jgi:hypothetical protein
MKRNAAPQRYLLASENGQAGSGVTDFLYDMSKTRQ